MAVLVPPVLQKTVKIVESYVNEQAGVSDKKDQAKRKLSDSGSTVDKKMKIDRSSSKSEKSTEKPVIGKLARQKAAEAKG